MTKVVETLEQIRSIMSYFDRISAKPRGIGFGVVERDRGRYWVDMAIIHIETGEGPVRGAPAVKGTVTITNAEDPRPYEPTPEEQNAIIEELRDWRWPTHAPVKGLKGTEPWTKHENDGVYEFRNAEGFITMVQVRVNLPHRRIPGQTEKRYISWSPWDDGVWRPVLPNTPLPLYNADLLARDKPGVVWLHEGAKAAAAVHRMVTGKGRDSQKALADHPWGLELQAGIHVGWIGGALAPNRTDWGPINSAAPERVIIVCDNDWDGRQAAHRIARNLTRSEVFMLRFDDTFPPGFDLADPFPESKFAINDDGIKVYVGLPALNHTSPVTWATEAMPNPAGTGRPIYVLTEPFKRQWTFVEDIDCYVNHHRPSTKYAAATIGRILGYLSQGSNMAEKMTHGIASRADRLTYMPCDPDDPKRLITIDDEVCFNVYKPPSIRAVKGDITPFMQYMTHMFPDPKERHKVLQWIATLIGRVMTRMRWGLLLVTEMQGTGKSTLADLILRPLVGYHNTVVVSSDSIRDGKNAWVEGKRLAICHELYTDYSQSTYDKLKDVITQDLIRVNEKYIKEHTIENHIHVFACSNSIKALKIGEHDRRWFVPRVNEEKWGEANFRKLYSWARAGGLGHILYWARHEWTDYVKDGEEAASTTFKDDIIDDGKSEVLKLAQVVGQNIGRETTPVVVMAKPLASAIKGTLRTSDTHLQIRREMCRGGEVFELGRHGVNNHLEYLVCNKAFWDMWWKAAESDSDWGVRKGANTPKSKMIKDHLKDFGQFMPSTEKGM